MSGPNKQIAKAWLDDVGLGVLTGLIVRDVTSTSLATTVEGGVIRMYSSTPGEAFNEFQIQDTAKTFTASKDTYAYVSSAGALGYIEVANGAAKPTQATLEAAGGVGAQFIAKVVSDSDEITSVTDLRQLSGADIRSDSFTVSFATAEQGAGYWVAPVKCRILKAQSSVQVALANTDAGTITFAVGVNDIYTAVTTGVITLALSSAIGTRASCVPTAVNIVDAGQTLRYTSAKTTAGGRTITQILYEALA